MSDQENIELTASGSGKSEAEVAFDLVSKLKGQGVWGERNQAAILDMFAECLDAARGLRAYPGQARVQVPIKQGAVKAEAPKQPSQAELLRQQAQQQVHAQQQVQAQQAAPTQQAAPQQQPVHAQQQALQQAYKA